MHRALQTTSFILTALITTIAATAQNIEPPPDMDTAEAALKASPRHGEYVNIDLPDTDTKLKTWIVFPERADKGPVVLVIHEIFGMSDWVNAVADDLAKHGFIAVAPDLISGKPTSGNNVAAVRALTDEEIITRINAARDYALELPAATAKSATVGFCWGGAASFLYATAQSELDAAVVFYGTAPDQESLANVRAPILGLYGEMDARVTTTIKPAADELARLEKSFEYEIYKDAGHGFLRAQSGREGANLAGTKKAWPRTIAFLKEHLEN